MPAADGQLLERDLAPFRGTYAQTPPMYSAVKVGGKRLYERPAPAKRSSARRAR